MMIPQDIVRELQLEVETNLAKARDTLVAAGVSGDDLDMQMAAERARLERWRDDVLSITLRLVQDKLGETTAALRRADAVLEAAADAALAAQRAVWLADGETPDDLTRKLATYRFDLDVWLTKSKRDVRARIDEPNAPSIVLQ